MAWGEAVIRVLGVGCRKGAGADAIVAAAEQVLATLAGEAPLVMATIIDKRDETGLAEAAARLGLALVFLPRERLADMRDKVGTYSARVVDLFGVPSVAEAAALAAAGEGATLLVPRRVSGPVTVAVAEGRTP
jgi:cobalamin biosynthesis protein CbiG